MLKLPSFVKRVIYFFLAFIQLFSVLLSPVFSDDISDLESEVDKKNEEVEQKESSLEQVKKEIEAIKKSGVSLDEKIVLMEKELKEIDKYIKAAQKQIELQEKDLESKEVGLESKKGDLNSVSTVLYKRSRAGFLEFLLSNVSGEDFVKSIIFKRFTILSYVEDVRSISQEYAELKQEKISLEDEKKGLDEERKGLVKAREDLVAEKARVAGQIASRNAAVARLGSSISLLKQEISDLQAAILIAKSGGTYISAEDVPTGGAGGLNDFLSKASSGSFGVFSIGAFTHRNGMSQWGAFGRASAGQSYQTILNAYYPNSNLSNQTTSKIKVQFCDAGSSCSNCINSKIVQYDFETEYLYRLGEMPESFPLEALKAQAVSARTYALNATNGGSGTVRGDQCGQVIAGKKTGKWKQAVDATSTVVLKNSSGKVFSTQYAAVHGGWINGVGWDTTNGQGGQSGWTANAWESKSGVTWFYKSWPGYQLSNSYQYGVVSCSAHPHPWLSGEEMADLVNTYLVIKGSGLKGSVNTAKILPVTLSSCPISGLSGSPYSMSDMRNLLNNPVGSVSSVTTKTSSGNTQYVFFNTSDGRQITMTGSEFYQVYNMRAPGYLSVNPGPSSFVHVDIRKKN